MGDGKKSNSLNTLGQANYEYNERISTQGYCSEFQYWIHADLFGVFFFNISSFMSELIDICINVKRTSCVDLIRHSGSSLTDGID